MSLLWPIAMERLLGAAPSLLIVCLRSVASRLIDTYRGVIVRKRQAALALNVRTPICPAVCVHPTSL